MAFRDLCSPLNIVRVVKDYMKRACSTNAEKTNSKFKNPKFQKS